MVHYKGHLMREPFTGHMGGNVTMNYKYYLSKWFMGYLFKLCHNVGARNVGALQWVIRSSVTKIGYMYRPLRTENDFKKFISKILGSRFMYIYVEHKVECDNGLGDAVGLENIGVDDNIGLEIVGPEVGVRTRSGVAIKTNVVLKTRIGRQN